MKRKDSKESSIEASTTSVSSTPTVTPVSSPQKSASHTISDNDEPLVSERAGRSGPQADTEIEDRRVQFDKTKTTDDNGDDKKVDDGNANVDDTKKKPKG